MNSLDRAKQFLANKAKKLALAAVPLAALAVAVPQQANAALLFAADDCALSEFGDATPISGSCNTSILPGEANGANGIKVSGNGEWNIPLGGGTAVFAWFGTANGEAFNGSLPISWDFDAVQSPFGSGGSLNWTLLFILNGDLDNPVATFTDLGQGPFSGSGSASISSPSVTHWLVRLLVQVGPPGSAVTLNVVVPNNSIDVNPGAADVPEPASILLFAPALGYLVWRRCSRKVSA